MILDLLPVCMLDLIVCQTAVPVKKLFPRPFTCCRRLTGKRVADTVYVLTYLLNFVMQLLLCVILKCRQSFNLLTLWPWCCVESTVSYVWCVTWMLSAGLDWWWRRVCLMNICALVSCVVFVVKEYMYIASVASQDTPVWFSLRMFWIVMFGFARLQIPTVSVYVGAFLRVYVCVCGPRVGPGAIPPFLIPSLSHFLLELLVSFTFFPFLLSSSIFLAFLSLPILTE